MHHNETTETIYTFIHAYIEANGYSPSQREIAQGCYMAQGSILRHLDRLESWGWIKRQPGRARSIALTQASAHRSKKRSNE